MLTLTFLGVGGAFAKRNFQSNALVEAWQSGPAEQIEPDDTLLIDFGTTGPLALHQLKDRPGFEYLNVDGVANYPKIRRVFVTHQHADHIGGLEELASMNTYVLKDPHSGKVARPELISPIRILRDLWDTSLKGGLCVLQDRPAVLEDYFIVQPLYPAGPGPIGFTMAERYRFEPFPTDHVRIEQKYDWPSFGLRAIDTRTNESVLYTSDTRCDFEAYAPLLAPARMCFHDVELRDAPSSVHAPLTQLRALPHEIRKKTILFHYGDHWDCGEFDFVADEFAGFARPQQRYVLFE